MIFLLISPILFFEPPTNETFSTSLYLHQMDEGTYAHHALSPYKEELETQRADSRKEFLLCHLNINSIQNKFEELVELIRKLKAHVIFVGETKIDSTYPNGCDNVLIYV